MFEEATLYRVQEQRVKGGIFVACRNVLKLYTFMFSVEISLLWRLQFSSTGPEASRDFMQQGATGLCLQCCQRSR